MQNERLHALTDGIFAIVTTLLVLDLKVPYIRNPTDQQLLAVLWDQRLVLLSYFISFAVLFVYWRAHNFVMSYVAKNMDITLLNLNGIFLFLVGLVPFSTHFLGLYSNNHVGISVYAVNVALIGLCILYIRIYVERSPSIDHVQRTPEQVQGALIRIVTPIVFSLLAIPVSFASPSVAFGLLLLAVAYNFYPDAADLTRHVLGRTIFNRLFEHNLQRIADHQASGDGTHPR